MKSAYSIRRPVANLYLVREKDRRLRRELLSVLAVAIPLSVAVLGYVWVSGQLWSVGYEVRRLEQTLEKQQERERLLTVRAAELSRPEEIERRAGRAGLAELGMDRLVFSEEIQ